ncbi:MAG: nucleotide exchange factor GrpE [Candidatus Gracilibacteria bacterium]
MSDSQENITQSQQDDSQNTDAGSAQDLSLEEILAQKEAEIKDLQEKLLRSQADFMNLKQRSEKEKMELLSFANERFAKGLISALDTFTQGIQHLPEELKDNSWVLGIIQFDKNIRKFLEDSNVTRMAIVPELTSFDPNMHEAVAQEAGDTAEIILEVYQDGYMYHDKVLRPAKVKVSV